jgi:hypothetical protein
MTEDDFKRIEHNLAEEIRRKNCATGAQQSENDYYHYSDVDNVPGMKNPQKKIPGKKHFFFVDPTESMFCSVKGMSTSIDLESSYTSSRPDSASTSSRILFVF